MENELIKKQVGTFSMKDKAFAKFGLGTCFLVLAWMDWNSVKTPTGKWAWAYRMAQDAFGPNGTSWLYMVIGGLLLLAGFWNWQAHLQAK